MAEKILKEFKLKIKGLTLVPASGGEFEVSLAGELVYSKIRQGRFPEYGEIQPEIKKRV